ncbi:hypothetical protein DASC09_031970 [Saccharomycopsis crataegensis]|uniref:Uncharacterized protein n=1 Tax=Saccharomycopsis crataegensis TaxID=43959 RepID=A0AAV5QMW0_9ASCO|nr:hypothetical protein DASC09_031970 [Saccharomycopsis crataegensis]
MNNGPQKPSTSRYSEYYTKFYELDHTLTKEERITLRDYFSEIGSKSRLGCIAAFGLGFGAVLFRNRSKISSATSRVKILRNQSPHLTNEELFAKLNDLQKQKQKQKQNNIGVKAFLWGLGSVLLFFPVTLKVSESSAYNGLVANHAPVDGEKAKVVKVADLLSQNNNILQWRVYYEMTIRHPEKAIKDPRLNQQNRRVIDTQQQSQRQPETMESHEEPSIGFSQEVRTPAAASPEPLYPKTIDTAPSDDTPSYVDNYQSGDGFGNRDSDDDIFENMGLAAGGSSNYSSAKGKNENTYSSSWDRIRAENNVEGGNEGGSSWEKIRRNSN